MKVPKLPRRRRPRVPELWFPDDEDDAEAARAGYLISIDPDAAPMHLTEPITAMRQGYFWVSAPELLIPDRYYLIGGPGQSSCEVVQVERSEWAHGQPRKIRRGKLKTIANLHPAGTLVRAITARFVADWAQEDAEDH